MSIILCTLKIQLYELNCFPVCSPSYCMILLLIKVLVFWQQWITIVLSGEF